MRWCPNKMETDLNAVVSGHVELCHCVMETCHQVPLWLQKVKVRLRFGAA